MTGIIKSTNFSGIASVTPIAATAPSAPVVSISKHDEERDRLHKRIAVLEDSARQHNVTIEALRSDVKRALDDGWAEGRKAGIEEANRQQSALLLLLEKAIEKSREDFSNALQSVSRLSASLARDCVEMILGSADDRAELINKIIDVQIAKIDKAALLVIEVSRHDFPDDDALQTLTSRLDLPAVNILAQSSLASGACVMTLRLGRMVVGIDQQWDRLRDALDEMSLPGGEV